MLKDNLRSQYCEDVMNTPTEDVTDLVKETQQQFDPTDFGVAVIGYTHGRPILARSSRYRNPRWDPFWKELKVASPDAIFVGTTAEFDDFRHGEHYLARDALDLAQIIQGASTFVGNRSCPYAIAEGLKIGRVLEVSPYVKNCLFPGALAIGFETAESRT